MIPAGIMPGHDTEWLFHPQVTDSTAWAFPAINSLWFSSHILNWNFLHCLLSTELLANTVIKFTLISESTWLHNPQRMKRKHFYKVVYANQSWWPDVLTLAESFSRAKWKHNKLNHVTKRNIIREVFLYTYINSVSETGIERIRCFVATGGI